MSDSICINATALQGGFVVVSTDDADKPGHCEYRNCGLLYPNIIRRAVQSSRITRTGILAIGGVTGVSDIEFINDCD